ncbi:MAG: hypothetical protein ACWA5U_03245 [bacterium]
MFFSHVNDANCHYDHLFKNNHKKHQSSWLYLFFNRKYALKQVFTVFNSILIGLVLSACENTKTSYATASTNERQIATTYRTLNATNCHQAASIQSPIIADLRANRLVDLVAVKGSVIHAENIHWLHVYPHLSHRPSCYIPMTNLVPVE